MTRNGYQHMVLDHTVDKVRAIFRRRGTRLSRLASQAHISAYQARVQRAVSRAFAPLPKRTPLNVSCTGIVERERYRIEKIVFESRPGCLVTANIYVPAGLETAAPAVVAPCGHSIMGKAAPLYSAFCQRLAANGFITLIYDPFNQGERDQYHRLKERAAVAGSTTAHNMMGKQLELIGEFFGTWRVWDGMRALDVLLDRTDVDPTRIGVTGNSGGGTLSTWLWAMDERFSMAAPSCFVTSFLNNLENEMPADCEQYPPGVIGAGLDTADFMIARAPKPVLLLGQTFDFFDRRGLRRVYEETRRIYELLDAADRIALFIGPQGHGYSVHNQEAMVRFFAEHAGTGPVVRLAETDTIPERELWATPDGNTVAAGASPIYELIAAKARTIARKRRPPAERDLAKAVTRLLDLPAHRAIPHYRIPRPVGVGPDQVARYAVETEGGVRAILHKRMVDRSPAFSLDVESELHLVLPHVSAEDDMLEDAFTRELNRPGPLYALDVRGLGESMPEMRGNNGFFQSYGMDYMMHGHGILLGESYLGRRVHDALSALELLAAEGATSIRLYGRGQGAILALFAAVLEPRIEKVLLRNCPLSFLDWTLAPLVAWPAANFPRGILMHFDIADLVRALGARVSIMEPWGPDMLPLTPDELSKALNRAGLSESFLVSA